MSTPSPVQPTEEMEDILSKVGRPFPGSAEEADLNEDPARVELVVTHGDTAGGAPVDAGWNKDSGGMGESRSGASASHPGVQDAVGHHPSMPPGSSNEPLFNGEKPLALLSRNSRLHSELFHVFISYRVATEKRLAQSLYDELHLVSRHPEEKLNIPQAGIGIYPRFAQKPTGLSQRMNEAKVFLDAKCLPDGKKWLEEFVRGLCVSMVFVPLLSWTEDNKGNLGGSLGPLCKLTEKHDNVLLELILALELKEHHLGSVKSIVPVFVGHGGSAFPWKKLEQTLIPDKVHEPTNRIAAEIMRQLKMDEHIISKMEKKTVKEIVDSIMKHQGVTLLGLGREMTRAHSANDEPAVTVDEVKSVRECARRVLRTVLREIGVINSSSGHFESSRPCGHEVIEWLEENALENYIPIFAASGLNSLLMVSKLGSEDSAEQMQELYDKHCVISTPYGTKPKVGDFRALCAAITRLAQDPKARSLQQRLEEFRDKKVTGISVLSRCNTVELMWCTSSGKWQLVITDLVMIFIIGYYLYGSFSMKEQWSLRLDMTGGYVKPFQPCIGMVVGCILSLVWLLDTLLFVYVSAYRTIPGVVRHFYRTTGATGAVWIVSGVIQTLQCRATESIITDGNRMFACTPWEAFSIGLGLVAASIILKYRQEYVIKLMVAVVGVISWVSCDWSTVRLLYTPVFYVGWFCIATYCLLVVGPIVAERMAYNVVNADVSEYNTKWDEVCGKEEECGYPLKELSGIVNKTMSELNGQYSQFYDGLSLLKKLSFRMRTTCDRFAKNDRGWKYRQLHEDLDLLFTHASLINEPFQALVEEILSKIKRSRKTESALDRFKRGPVKQPQRAIEKVTRLYRRDCARLTDFVRCTCVMNDSKELLDFVTAILKKSVVGMSEAQIPGHRFVPSTPPGTPAKSETVETKPPMLRTLKIQNRFDQEYNVKNSAGYRDVSIILEVGWQMEDGIAVLKPVSEWSNVRRHICEVQVHHCKFNTGTSGQDAKHHQNYVGWRDLLAR